MRRGEVQQVFIYLMVMLVVGALMLVAYKAIDGLIDKGCDVELSDFRTNFKSLLEKNSNYLTQYSKPVKSPCDYDKICFLDTQKTGLETQIADEVIKQEYIAKTGRNIFLVRSGVTEYLLSHEGMIVEPGFFCAESIGGSFRFRLEGVQRGVLKVSDPNYSPNPVPP